jgi:multicomponent Na+:H+ antiporter subunit B
MSSIVKTTTKFIGGMIFLFGTYITLYGHMRLGEGFAGGVIMAAALILITLTHGSATSAKKLSVAGASILASLGALLFTGIGITGFWHGAFLVNFLPKGRPFDFLSGGTLPILNLGIALAVAGGIYIIFQILATFEITQEKD